MNTNFYFHNSIHCKTFSRLTIFFLLAIELHLPVFAQKNNMRELIQFSGVVVTADSLTPVPFTHITIINTRKGMLSDTYGFFSFVAQKKDTIVFSSMGYRNVSFIIPDSLTTNRYSLIQLMTSDTLMLDESVVYPWPSVEQFREAFVKMNIPDDDLERAKKNLAFAEMKERMKQLPNDGSINYKYFMEGIGNKLYTAGQYPSYNLFSPIAWAKFIQAWREGKFKRKD